MCIDISMFYYFISVGLLSLDFDFDLPDVRSNNGSSSHFMLLYSVVICSLLVVIIFFIQEN